MRKRGRNKVTRDEAQSEVIGAILLVVITLILASVLAVYVFDVGGQQLQERPPQVSFAFENTTDGLVATHNGGQALRAERVEIVVTDDGDTPTAAAFGETATAGDTTTAQATDTDFGTGRIQVGDTAVVGEGVGEDDTVRIVYINPDTNQGSVVGRYVGG
ncbi:MAG: type IV pilin [Halobacteria archaeon]